MIGVAERMFRLTQSGMVINAGGKLIARATFMLWLYRTSQWIIPLLFTNTERMFFKRVFAITRVLLTTQAGSATIGFGNALR